MRRSKPCCLSCGSGIGTKIITSIMAPDYVRIFVIMLLPMLLPASYYAWIVWRRARWATTTAEIVSSSVGGTFTSRYRGTLVTECEYRIIFRYSIGGVYYESDRLFHTNLMTRTVLEGQVKPLLAQYPVGKKIDIRYNPATPSESFVEFFEPRAPFFALAGVGLVTMLLIYLQSLAN